jgi:3-phosphoshikimate 1-carboxyvinyltransferase
MDISVSPAQAIDGIVNLPGDKSISHRYGILGAIAEGTTTIHNYATGGDCQSTLRCMQALGARVERDGAKVVIHGGKLNEPKEMLDAGNSGSTIRMLSGILAAQPFTSRMGGDESLSRRPMGRIIRPLREMGADIDGSALDGKAAAGSSQDAAQYPPLTIRGRKLHGIDYTLPMASAQVKSCVLMAGLFAEGETIVREPVRTRDHTEIALKGFGADLEVQGKVIRLAAGAKLTGQELMVPGDLSSATFFLVAALLMKESNLLIHHVGLNPTRSALLDFLVGIGAAIKVIDVQQSGGELIGDLRVRASKIKGGVIEGALSAALIDEIPALAVLGAASENGLIVRDAGELRVKETDRIATLEANFKLMGVEIETTPDGFRIPGGQKFHAAKLDSAGDHRIAMAFAVAALAADGPCTIGEAEAASVSFPEFYNTLQEITRR